MRGSPLREWVEPIEAARECGNEIRLRVAPLAMSAFVSKYQVLLRGFEARLEIKGHDNRGPKDSNKRDFKILIPLQPGEMDKGLEPGKGVCIERKG